MEFLLSTLPESASENYKKKLQTSIKFWREKGGCLDETVINKLIELEIPHEVVNETNYKTIKKPVRMEYLDDINISESKEIPTYKRMCICIMKNDHLCKYMGFSLTKNEVQLRKQAETKYSNIC
jgi:predicted phosphoadenosine phosphosulfate sulfurtransferase